MKEGDVVLTPILQADGSVKNRPAILLREFPPYKDFLVCGVSTQLHQEIKGFDQIVSPSDPDFADSGKKSESLVRLGFLAMLPRAKIAGSIGAISVARHKKLLTALAVYLTGGAKD
ncbi:MAG TPA: type II toxin-antitoxin system PemK/MazF family toxin [Pyrinomonadaceae bacterium]|jgi:mRNA interferase MazF|nr:type II toxin-antitoxin system PemK/MazF family toxin [Pyrinomonadaceae bacterium]